MTKSIEEFLIPASKNRRTKDTVNRIINHRQWMNENGFNWYDLKLSAYRDYLKLEKGLAPASIKAHLSSVRGHYRNLLENDLLYKFLVYNLKMDTEQAQFITDYLRQQLKESPRYNPERQPASDLLILSPDEIETFLRQPGTDSLPALRDTALLCFIAATGIREHEISVIHVRHLKVQSGLDEIGLQVPDCPKCRERFIPYGEMVPILQIIERWLQAASIQSGPVFRGFHKGNKTVRNTGLKAHAVRTIFASYSIKMDGEETTITPFDIRRAYAQQLHRYGISKSTIKQQLGLQPSNNLERYLDDESRNYHCYTFQGISFE